MDLLRDILETFLRQNKESDETVNESIETELRLDDDKSTLSDDESTIEREIIQCQMKHGRLLIQTGKALRRRYQNKLLSGQGWTNFRGDPVSDKVDRTIRRLAKRKYRGNCPVKAEQEQLEKTLKPVIDYFLKKKSITEFGQAL